MSIFDRRRRNMIFVAKIFNKNVDGPYNGGRMLNADLSEFGISAGDIICEAFALNDQYYAVYAHVVKGSKKEEVLKTLGFIETKVG